VRRFQIFLGDAALRVQSLAAVVDPARIVERGLRVASGLAVLRVRERHGALRGRMHRCLHFRHRRRGLAPLRCEIARLERNLRVRGLDMLDGTPIVDIKPYLSNVPEEKLRRGWLETAKPA
jgi:tRNA (Thr-GGU) A37 N-methylase